MKLTKQQLIKVIKEELNAMLAEGDPLDYHQSGVHIVPTGTGFSRSTLGPPMAPEEPKYVDAPHDGGIPVVWDGPLAYPDPRFVRDFSTYEQDVEAGRATPSWEEATEAADTGWGWGSLEETIKEELNTMLAETGADFDDVGEPVLGAEDALALWQKIGGRAEPRWTSREEDLAPSPYGKTWLDRQPAGYKKYRSLGTGGMRRTKSEQQHLDSSWLNQLYKKRDAMRSAQQAAEISAEDVALANLTAQGALEETIKENLTHILKELDAATVSVRVKKLPQPGDPPSPRYLTPAQANLLGPGLKPGTPGEVPEEEWKKGGRVKFAWPRGVKDVGRRKTRYIQKDYLQTDPWG